MRRKKRENPEDVAISMVKRKSDRDGFYVKEIYPKGRGVFAKANFQKGEFLLQYAGPLLSGDEGDKLEEEDGSSGFRFFIKFKGKEFCIDATDEPTTGPKLGRLINHGEKGEVNVKLAMLDVDGTPALCLFAHTDINEGKELLYDYGVPNSPSKQQAKLHSENGSTSSSQEKDISLSSLEKNISSSSLEKDISSSSQKNCEETVSSSSDVKDQCLSQENTSFKYASSSSSRSCGVQVLQTNNGRKRKYDKSASCPFCETSQAKLPRHLSEFKEHRDEPEISQWLTTTDPELKAKRLTKMRNYDQYAYIRAKLREVGRMVIEYKNSTSESNAASM